MRQDYHLNTDADTGSSVREEGQACSGTVGIRPAQTTGPPATAAVWGAAIIRRKVTECEVPPSNKDCIKTTKQAFKKCYFMQPRKY